MQLRFYHNERHANGQSDRIEENAGDIQYILETLTGMEERLSKIESCCNQGNGTILFYKVRDRKKSFRILFFELCSYCISIFQTLSNRMQKTVFRNPTGNTLFRCYFDFRPYVTIYGPKPKRTYQKRTALKNANSGKRQC